MAFDLNKQQKQLAAAGCAGLLLLAAAYVRFFWLPLSKSKAELRAAIQDTDAKIARAQAQASRLKSLQNELAALNRQAVEAEKRLPKNKDIPDVLVSLSTLASRYGVSIQSFAPGVQKSQQYFTELSYPMSVRGGYHAIGRFLAALALEQRIFNVRDLILPSSSGGQITATFVLVAYQYKG